MPSLPGFETNALRQTAALFGGTGDDAGESDATRFVRAVARLLRRRTRIVGSVVEPAVFLLYPETSGDDGFEWHPMIDSGSTPVEGHLWMVGPVVASGHCTPLGQNVEADWFLLVNDQLGLSDRPAVVFHPAGEPGTLRYYPSGLGQPDTIVEVSWHTMEVTLARIFDVVDLIYQGKLKTPIAQNSVGKLWQESSKYWVAENAEELIQMYLEPALMTHFSDCLVESEVTQTSGRFDIAISQRDPDSPNRIVRHAIIELKVVKDFGSTGSKKSAAANRRWLNEGIDQAYSYASEWGCPLAAVCCFDMRAQPDASTCFIGLRTKANRLDVYLQAWPLYASAKAFRSAFVASVVPPIAGSGAL